jgi:hypothetical protein
LRLRDGKHREHIAVMVEVDRDSKDVVKYLIDVVSLPQLALMTKYWINAGYCLGSETGNRGCDLVSSIQSTAPCTSGRAAHKETAGDAGRFLAF